MVARTPGTDVTQLSSWARVRATVGFAAVHVFAFQAIMSTVDQLVNCIVDFDIAWYLGSVPLTGYFGAHDSKTP